MLKLYIYLSIINHVNGQSNWHQHEIHTDAECRAYDTNVKSLGLGRLERMRLYPDRRYSLGIE